MMKVWRWYVVVGADEITMSVPCGRVDLGADGLARAFAPAGITETTPVKP